MLAVHAFNQIAAVARDILEESRDYALASERRWREFGYKPLGSGHYSVAMEHPDKTRDTVIKIGRDPTDSWLAFAVYAMCNPAPVFPTIISIKLYSRFYIVEMEKLTATPSHIHTEFRDKWVMSKDIAYEWWKEQLTASDLEAVRSMEQVLGRPNDVHPGNVMYRGEQAVLIDPYADAAGGCPPKVKRYMPKLHDTSNPRASQEVDQEHARDIAELATAGADFKAGAQEEVPTLREQPIMHFGAHAQRMAWLLPPLPRNSMVPKGAAARLSELARMAPNFVHAYDARAANRLQEAVRDWPARADQLIGRHIFVGMAPKRRDNFTIEGAIQHRMVGPAAPRHIANIRPMFHEFPKFAKHFFDFDGNIVPETVPFGQPSQVPDTSPIPAELNIQLQARAGHLPKQHGRQPVQVRRDSSRGRIVCHKSRGVSADDELARDKPERGKDRVTASEIRDRQAAYRDMARPGQGGPERHEFAGKRADVIRFDTLSNIIPKRP